MTTDTAHQFWNNQWREADATSKWAQPEPEVLAHFSGHASGASVLDLGAGIGRHSLALTQMGFAVTALDAAEHSVQAISSSAAAAGLAIGTHCAPMTDLPFDRGTFDHVLSWNVIYHGDEDIVRTTISEVARVLRPGGSFIFTMLPTRRLAVEQARAQGREISRNTWIFDADETSDKSHPHYYCSAHDLTGLLSDFEIRSLHDREHDTPGSLHWHVVAVRNRS